MCSSRADTPSSPTSASRKAIAAATDDGATRDKGLTSAGVALGTPAYMAPEQAVGDVATDHRADLYALGVIAYEALAGTHPFRCSVGASLCSSASHRDAATARCPQD
jgi:serine/threonine-protein kinase